jgi:hypothetical protein
MDDTDLNSQNRADSGTSNDRPNANAEPYDPVSNAEDVYQDTDTYGPGLPVEVCVKGQVRTQELPTQLGALLSVAVPSMAVAGTRAVRLLAADPRRKRATLEIPATNTLRLGATQAMAQGEYAYRMYSSATAPAVREITAADELWGIGDASAFIVSVANEQWQR